MFFFFAGGVQQQVKKVLKSGAGRCINCGSAADLVENEKVLKLFFVPVWRWPGKEPLMHCDNCNIFFFPTKFNLHPPVLDKIRCNFCSREVNNTDYRFCPFCGSGL
ncbi:uncharacterized protein LOC124932472 [Impatiens glandulifera]|uniref:uncharacterized protein LOC124932472 n=1 Tax=Impatiens glandulifera TaxID=253017 RepID=UPI001FB17248|nr:uncharacterized protein LOC124932472 [Impatiens glandulifera]